MYISEVSGHHSATLAIEKSLRMISPGSDILNINAFKYTNPISEQVVNRIYMNIIKRTPQIWDYLYDNPSVVKKLENMKNLIHQSNSPKLKKLFEKFNPDVILCSQAYPCGMVADYKKTTGSPIPLIAVLTDYVPHSYWIYDTVDYYITPSEEVSRRLIKKGVAPEKVLSYGIPFDPSFNVSIDKESVLNKYKLDANLPIVLIMGGGQGLIPVKAIIKSLERSEFPLQIIVVTGVNKKLYKSLKKKLRRFRQKILLLGYVNTINELMGAADLLVTKPGGITTAEALAKRLPLLIVKPIPGQEMNNTIYLTQKMAAIQIHSPKEIHLVINDLLANPGKLRALRENAAAISKPHSSMDIARFLLTV